MSAPSSQTDRPRAARVLRVPAATPERAEAAADHLRGQGIDVDGVDGRFVLVPSGWSPIFVLDLSEIMVLGGFTDDDEAAQWAALAGSL